MILTELRKLYLNRGSILTSCAFFALALFCFTIATEEPTLMPAFIWILAILTFLFSTPVLLKEEFQAGLLDDIALHPLSSSFYLLSKISAEVLLLGFPLIIISALFAPSLPFLSTLLIGLPALSALGILGGLLTVRTQGGGMLISLIILPLTIPLLLFSLSTIEMTRLGLDSFPPFCLLISVSILLVILAIGAGQWALSIAVEE